MGAPAGIVAGQAWECEGGVVLGDYHRAKTGALFVAAATAGAQAAGGDSRPWCAMGERLGEAYQVADDIYDATASAGSGGKPAGRDRALGRPSAVDQLGLPAAVRQVKSLVAAAVAHIPECPGGGALRTLIEAEARRMLPGEIARLAA